MKRLKKLRVEKGLSQQQLADFLHITQQSIYKYENDIKDGQSIVILWKKQQSIENATFKNIEKDIIKILDKAKILIEE